MSTRQTWTLSGYSAQSAMQQNLIRQAELARLLAAQAVAEAAQRRAEHERKLAQTGQRLEAIDRSVQTASAQLGELDRIVEQARHSLRAADEHLRQCAAQAAALQSDTADASCKMTAAIQNTRSAAEELTHLTNSNVESLESLAGYRATADEWGKRIAGLQEDIRRKQAECDFLAQVEASRPSAAAVLLAMEGNDYHLRETVKQGDLIAYFQKQDAEQIIAVRIKAPEKTSAAASVFELIEAETFNSGDPECLGELDDFETALEDRIPIKRAGQRIYPRADGASVLPHPERAMRQKRTASTASERERV
jgi:chromosome segregation ATPase